MVDCSKVKTASNGRNSRWVATEGRVWDVQSLAVILEVQTNLAAVYLFRRELTMLSLSKLGKSLKLIYVVVLGFQSLHSSVDECIFCMLTMIEVRNCVIYTRLLRLHSFVTHVRVPISGHPAIETCNISAYCCLGQWMLFNSFVAIVTVFHMRVNWMISNTVLNASTTKGFICKFQNWGNIRSMSPMCR